MRIRLGRFSIVSSPYFQSLSHISDVFQRIVNAILELESDWTVGSGAIFLACKAK
jgi:hypothetical protein